MRTGMKPVMLIVAIVFVGAIFLWGAGQMVSTIFGASEEDLAANINGQKITLRQYAQRYYLHLRQLEEDQELTEAQRDDLAEQVLNQVIEEDLWISLAHKLNIEVTDKELSDYLSVRYGIGTRITNDQYKQMVAKLYGLDQGGGSLNEAIKEFQGMNRRLIMVSKAKAVMAAAARLPETRARLFYEASYRPVTMDIVFLDATQLITSETVSETEAQAWYDANPDYFFSPTRARLDVLSWSQATALATVTVSESELEEYYEEHKYDESQSGKIRLSSILLTINTSETANKGTLEKGTKLVDDLRKQFEAMVDPAKRDELWWTTLESISVEKAPANIRKGDVGFISSDQIASRFGKQADEAIAGIFPGDITMPVVTPDGLRIFRREEDFYPLDWKKAEFQQAVAYDKAGKLIREYAETAQKRLTDGEDAQLVAKELNANYTLTPYFVAMPQELAGIGIARDVNIGGLNPNTDFASMKSFAYKNKVGAVAPLMPLDLDAQLRARLGGTLPIALQQGMVFYVYRLNDRQTPGILPFTEGKDVAINMVKKQKALDSLKAKAQEIATLAKSVSLSKAGTEQKLEVKHYEKQPLTAVPYIPSPEVAQMLMNQSPGTVTDPISVGTGWMIASLTSIADFDSVGYQAARSDMMSNFHDSEIPLIFRAWVADQLAQGEETGNIKIYRDRCKDYLAGKYHTKQATGGFGGYY
jgi:hypothetical protein